ncbi:hypothetical protein [Christiangramia sp. SM2212]|uniref:Carboxypeptidase regulatory-like domain-containing protein n=1 Tax=Christiangramia sediminicola TaxID=3073267 RepID=A0ABU1ESN3_9FLAO|nr:hypothetical protein [Christiangramia sp. SM2212]MDR5591410.1 hypothetical protein [Christiangramia sp. SM2212]
MDNRRAQFKGELVDENNIALSDAKVNLGIEIPGFKTSNFQTIAEDITNGQGQFDFLTLQPENKVMYLRISNISEESNFSLELVQTILNNAGPLFDFGEIQIRTPRRFSVNFQNTSGSEEQVFFEYTYVTFTPLVSDLPGWRTVRGYNMEYEESEEQTWLGSFGENTEKVISLTTLLNTEIKLRYSIGEPLHLSDNIQEINFVIDQTMNEYVVEY